MNVELGQLVEAVAAVNTGIGAVKTVILGGLEVKTFGHFS